MRYRLKINASVEAETIKDAQQIVIGVLDKITTFGEQLNGLDIVIEPLPELVAEETSK